MPPLPEVRLEGKIGVLYQEPIMDEFEHIFLLKHFAINKINKIKIKMIEIRTQEA